MKREHTIPLLRPEIYNLEEAFELIRLANADGRLANFGPLYQQGARMLSTLCSSPEFSHYPRHAVLTKSGTEAIKLALQQSLPRGFRVALPDYTHVGAYNAVIQAGMIPIIVGCQLRSMGPDAKLLLRHADQFDALLISSCFGFAVDFDAYDFIAAKLSKPIIYDLAGGVGMFLPTPHPVCFSFHATKNLSIGEGGAVLFVDPQHAVQAQRLANFDVDTSDGSILSPWGGNGKMDEIHAAFLCVALENFQESVIAKARVREQNINLYQDAIGVVAPGDRHLIAQNGMPSLCVIFGIEYPEILSLRLKGPKIESKPYYPLLSKVASIAATTKVLGPSESTFETALALPSSVTAEEMTEIIDELKNFQGSVLL